MQRQQPNDQPDVSHTNDNKTGLKLSHLEQIMKRFNEIEQEHSHSVELIIEDALKRRTRR